MGFGLWASVFAFIIVIVYQMFLRVLYRNFFVSIYNTRWLSFIMDRKISAEDSDRVLSGCTWNHQRESGRMILPCKHSDAPNMSAMARHVRDLSLNLYFTPQWVCLLRQSTQRIDNSKVIAVDLILFLGAEQTLPEKKLTSSSSAPKGSTIVNLSNFDLSLPPKKVRWTHEGRFGQFEQEVANRERTFSVVYVERWGGGYV